MSKLYFCVLISVGVGSQRDKPFTQLNGVECVIELNCVILV